MSGPLSEAESCSCICHEDDYRQEIVSRFHKKTDELGQEHEKLEYLQKELKPLGKEAPSVFCRCETHHVITEIFVRWDRVADRLAKVRHEIYDVRDKLWLFKLNSEYTAEVAARYNTSGLPVYSSRNALSTSIREDRTIQERKDVDRESDEPKTWLEDSPTGRASCSCQCGIHEHVVKLERTHKQMRVDLEKTQEDLKVSRNNERQAERNAEYDRTAAARSGSSALAVNSELSKAIKDRNRAIQDRKDVERERDELKTLLEKSRQHPQDAQDRKSEVEEHNRHLTTRIITMEKEKTIMEKRRDEMQTEIEELGSRSRTLERVVHEEKELLKGWLQTLKELESGDEHTEMDEEAM